MKKSLAAATNGTFNRRAAQRREERLGHAVHQALRELRRCYRRHEQEQGRIAAILEEVQTAWEELH